jgi:hypothetical protein
LIFARAGLAVDRISLFMALLSSRGLSRPAPTSSRQERHSAYFNNELDIARSQVKHSSHSTSATNCCNLFVVETRLFRFKACEVPVGRLV